MQYFKIVLNRSNIFDAGVSCTDCRNVFSIVIKNAKMFTKKTYMISH